MKISGLFFGCFLAAGIFMLAEIAARMIWPDRLNPPVFTEISCDDATWVTTNKNYLEFYSQEVFRKRKPPGTIRLACVGGSSVNGGKFRTSFVWPLAFLLKQAFPGASIEVINAGGKGKGFHEVFQVACNLMAYDLDFLVLYSGHNEIISHESYLVLPERPELFRYITAQAYRSRLIQKARRFVIRRRQGRFKRQVRANVNGTDQPAGPAIAPYVHKILADQYIREFRKLVKICREKDVGLVAGIPACNLMFPPNIPSRPEKVDSEIAPVIRKIGELERKNDYDEIRRALHHVSRHATDPEVAYWMGRVYYHDGAYREALRWLQTAKDYCPSGQRISTILRKLLAENLRELHIPAFDAFTELGRYSRGGIPGFNLFEDHCHPNDTGSCIIARAFVRILEPNIRKRLTQTTHREPLPTPSYPSHRAEYRLDTLKKRFEQLHFDALEENIPALLSDASGDAVDFLETLITSGDTPLPLKKKILENIYRFATPATLPLLTRLLKYNQTAFDAALGIVTITGYPFPFYSWDTSTYRQTYKHVKKSVPEYRTKSRHELHETNREHLPALLNSEHPILRMAGNYILEEDSLDDAPAPLFDVERILEKVDPDPLSGRVKRRRH